MPSAKRIRQLTPDLSFTKKNRAIDILLSLVMASEQGDPEVRKNNNLIPWDPRDE